MKKRSVLSRILTAAGCLLFAVLLALIGFTAWMISQQKVPQLFGYSTLRIVSGSMAPTYEVGSCVLVRKTDPQQLREGDVIAFYSSDPQLGGAPVTHRIVEVEQDGKGVQFITKGDANPTPDEYPVPADRTIGRVTGRAVLFEWVAKLVSNPVSFLLLILLPLAAILLLEIRNLVKVSRSDDEDEE